MYDELTLVDIKKMEEEIHYRRVELAPKLMAEMKMASRKENWAAWARRVKMS